MRVGTDCNITVCRAEGYPVVEIPSKKHIEKLDPSRDLHLTISIPSRWESGYLNRKTTSSAYRVDSFLSFNDLKEIYEEYADDSFRSFMDWDNCPINLENPTVYDYLHLAGGLDSYYGLYNFGH